MTPYDYWAEVQIKLPIHLLVDQARTFVVRLSDYDCLSVAVAVTNAVLDALSNLGVRHIDTPLTPEKLWRAIHGKEGI